MSEREISAAEKLTKMIPLIKWLLGGAFALGMWVAGIQFQQVQALKAIEKNSTEVQKIRSFEVWQASTDASRYTSKEATALSNTMNSLLAGHDKRLQRVEDAQVATARSLERIEDKLGIP